MTIRALFLTIFLTLSLVGVYGSPAAAKAKALAVIKTKAGNVVISEENRKRQVALEKNVLYEGTGFMSVHHFFKPKDYEAIMIKDFTGPIACPIQYRFVIVKDGEAAITPPIGHCSGPPEVTLKKQSIIVEFKAFGSLAPATWTYDGQELKRTQ